MEYLKRLREVLVTTFILPNDGSFDGDFHQLLQILYFYGFHRPVPSTRRTIYGVLFLTLGYGTEILAMMKEIINSLSQGQVHQALVSGGGGVFVITVVIHLITFMAKEKEVVEMIKSFQTMHEGEDPAFLVKNRNKCCQVIKIYKIYLSLIMPSLTCIYLSGFRLFKLLIPSLYDGYSEGFLYGLSFVVNFFHGCSLISLFTVSDLLPILLMVRSGSNFEMLGQKLRRCAASEEMSENEQELIACIKYHQKVLDETKKIQSVFSYFFLSKACGVIVGMTTFLLVVMTNNESSQSNAYVIGVFGLGISLFQIGSLCLIGQWLTTKAANLTEASYDCAWFNQSASFKKMLMILRYVCQREVKVGTIRFDFSNKSFYEMLSNTYYYYNTMSPSMDSVGGRQ